MKQSTKNKQTRSGARAAMKVETVTLASLELDPRNARRHPDRNLESIQASLTRFGQQKPIVVDGDGVIVAGNGTYAAAKALGWKSIDVVRTKLRGAEARAFAIADNRTGELAEWDAGELRKQLDELEDAGIPSEELAFSDAEVEALLKEVAAETGSAGGKSTAGAGASAGAVADSYKVVITCRDEAHQTEVLDAIDNGPADRLGELLKGCDSRALVG